MALAATTFQPSTIGNSVEYKKLGRSGLDVPGICVGCMGFGDLNRWGRPWLIGQDKADEVVKHALDLGLNWFDTANMYSIGASEEILGNALKRWKPDRDELVIQTKVNQKMGTGPNRAGSSRKAIMSEIDHSLKRLQLDYVDVYILHRWDWDTPIEETMEAMNDVVKAGKARYIGASAMFAWQFEKAYMTAKMHGWANFITMQNHLNLLYREDEGLRRRWRGLHPVQPKRLRLLLPPLGQQAQPQRERLQDRREVRRHQGSRRAHRQPH